MFDHCVTRLLQVLKGSVLVLAGLLLYRTAELLRTATEVTAALPAVVREEMAATRSAAAGEVRITRRELLARMDRFAGTAESGLARIEREIAGLRESSTLELRDLSRTASDELRATGASVRKLTDTYAGLPGDFKYATSQIWDCEANPDCLENRYVTVSRALERASRAVEHSAPLIASSMERSAANSERTTAESAVLLKNLSGSFKPLPWWLRIPLQIAGPAVQLATPLVIR